MGPPLLQCKLEPSSIQISSKRETKGESLSGILGLEILAETAVHEHLLARAQVDCQAGPLPAL